MLATKPFYQRIENSSDKLSRIIGVRFVDEFDIAGIIRHRLTLGLPCLWPERTLRDEIPRTSEGAFQQDPDEFWDDQWPNAPCCVLYPILRDNLQHDRDLLVMVFREGVTIIIGLQTEPNVLRHGGTLKADSVFALPATYDSYPHKLLLRIWTNLRQFVVPQKNYRFNHLKPEDETDRLLIQECPYESLHYTHPACLTETDLEILKSCCSSTSNRMDSPMEYIDHDCILIRGYWTGLRLGQRSATPPTEDPNPPLPEMANPEFLKIGNRNMLAELVAISTALRSSLCLKSFEELISKQCRVLPSIHRTNNHPGIFKAIARRLQGVQVSMIKHSPRTLTKQELQQMHRFIHCENILADTYVTLMDINCHQAFHDAPDMYWNSEVAYSLYKRVMTNLCIESRVKVVDFRQGILREAIQMLEQDAETVAEHRAAYILIPLLLLTCVATILNHP